jgi:integrase/recombinase XerD
VAVVADFARFLGRSPDQAQPEDLRRYQLHLAAQGASPGKMNAAVSALRFFFKVTLGRQGYGERLARETPIRRLDGSAARTFLCRSSTS